MHFKNKSAVRLHFREQEDLTENINVIRRNLPAKKDGIASYLNQPTQEIADQIARTQVDKALEMDRKKLVKKSGAKEPEKVLYDRAVLLNAYAEVAVYRATEQLTSDVIQDASNNISNLIKHKCNGNLTLLTSVDVTRENAELPAFVRDMTQLAPSNGQKPAKKKLSPAMQKRESLRRARNKNGILLSSLKKKIYHCNCIDCQSDRIALGKPAYLEPIDVENLDLGELPDSIPMEKKKSRGRPRKYPRLDDVMRYKNSIANPSTSER